MSIDNARAAVTGRIWQGIAQSGVDTSMLPKENLERLVSAIADSVLVSVDELMQGAATTRPTFDLQKEKGEEQVLWEGRPFLSMAEHYTVTTERVRISRGVFGKDTEDVELIRIQDIDHSQALTERMMNIGDVVLHTTDESSPDVVLRNVSDPAAVHEIIRSAMIDARGRYHVGFRQEV
jgi:hypothetical protein